MSAPNRNTLWGRTLVGELAAAGLDAAVVAPGSRSTPLAVALADADIEVFSHLDERSAAFFALGRGRRTGRPTAAVCTSGTAAAEFHPAVVEADRARVPLLLVTADRPPELWDSGANQTVDQEGLYGDATRWDRTLPEPEPTARKLRGLRTTAARAVAAATGTPPGPVHLNVPFRKPLEPTPVEGDVPDDLAERRPRAGGERDPPYVRVTRGAPAPDAAELDALADSIRAAERGLVVCGPADDATPSPDALRALADATGFPVLADPLSGARFGGHVADLPVLGGYDGYIDAVAEDLPAPEVVVRFGASPTSKALRRYLADADPRQLLVDPAGGWREATYTASDLLVAAPDAVARGVADRLDRAAGEWADRLHRVEERYWELLDGDLDDIALEGSVLAAVAAGAPDPATLVVSNSMPVRDLDRFGRPREAALTVLGNRGASGIDGVTSTALGAGSAVDEPLVCVLGDLAFYHDMNGLLAVERCGVDATVVLVNNDGGGIFHKLPIESFDPPFTELFKTPHGLDFTPVADLYGLEFVRAEGMAEFRAAYGESLASGGTQVIEVCTDAEHSHRRREALAERVRDALP
ncbi:MAG: 2-succinyl-5-enolpyruvyl-6-hydroxy-3-cyclohexene-1-carboxylic-acid synthase [Halobacteriaceae archaeon]